MSPTVNQLAANRLLAALPPHELRRLQSDVRLVELADAEILSEPAARILHADFPIAGAIALSNPDAQHSGLEVGLIGNEGMFGTPLVLGGQASSLRAMVQGPGEALRIDSAAFCRQLQQCPGMRLVLKRYIQVRMEQLAQSMLCSRFHLLEARLAKLLLMIRDRAHSESFHVTHEALARRLGVRRAGVTAAATEMQRRGLISYHRGDIHVSNRARLLVAACTCFAADNATYAAMLRGIGTDLDKPSTDTITPPDC